MLYEVITPTAFTSLGDLLLLGLDLLAFGYDLYCRFGGGLV